MSRFLKARRCAPGGIELCAYNFMLRQSLFSIRSPAQIFLSRFSDDGIVAQIAQQLKQLMAGRQGRSAVRAYI
eukprot:evm.model.NODE_14513_length_12311_cov_35.819756.1